jgi:hypothetical protein
MENPTLVPNSTSDKNNSGDRYAEFEILSRELAEKELELSTLENKLSQFEGKYARTIGILFVELDEIEREIAKELLRLNPKEEYRQGFQRAERKAKASREAVDEKTTQEDKKPFRPSDELKNLFRKVAKAVHPDLSTDPQERALRNSMMIRANEAYKNGDTEGLNQIWEEWEHRDKSSYSTQTKVSQFDQLEQKIRQAKARIKKIEERIFELKKSELYKLMVKVEQAELEGYDLLNDMAKDLQDQILKAQKLLDSLKQQ